jgi:hypothetical protein
MSAQYGNITADIRQLESSNSDSSGKDNGGSIQAQLYERRARLKEMEDMADRVYIVINRT